MSRKKGIWIAVGVGLVAIGATANSKIGTRADSPSAGRSSSASVSSSTSAPSAHTATHPSVSTSAAPRQPPEPSLTNQQENAAASAEQYLDMSGFSKQGLIDQLSSSAGDGYSVADATVAVNSLRVDWNAEAVEAGKAYMDMSPMSCSGLISQLESSAGDKFTHAQAQFGAKGAGAC
jgi:hypothetical protein